MNYEEIQTAKTAKDKAGDNQSLTTYAETPRNTCLRPCFAW
jgi:hypothetical protein